MPARPRAVQKRGAKYNRRSPRTYLNSPPVCDGGDLGCSSRRRTPPCTRRTQGGRRRRNAPKSPRPEGLPRAPERGAGAPLCGDATEQVRTRTRLLGARHPALGSLPSGKPDGTCSALRGRTGVCCVALVLAVRPGFGLSKSGAGRGAQGRIRHSRSGAPRDRSAPDLRHAGSGRPATAEAERLASIPFWRQRITRGILR